MDADLSAAMPDQPSSQLFIDGRLRPASGRRSYDNIGPEELMALQRDLADPAKAHLYDGLNVVEALQLGPLRQLPRTGHFEMDGRVTIAAAQARSERGRVLGGAVL